MFAVNDSIFMPGLPTNNVFGYARLMHTDNQDVPAHLLQVLRFRRTFPVPQGPWKLFRYLSSASSRFPNFRQA